MFSNNYPQLQILNAIFSDKYPFMGSTISNGYAAFGDSWASEVEELLTVMFASSEKLTKAVDGYVRFSMDVSRRQSRFDDVGVYPQKSFNEVADEVYLNDDYMERHYLPGLLLSHLLWPHHYRQSRFFVATFLHDMEIMGANSFVDAGVGTGFLSRLTLAACPDITGIGFDVSPAAKKFAQQQVANYQFADRYQCKLLDLCHQSTEVETDWLISAEVLEHLEDPLSFLQRLRAILRPGGKGFITAAINAAEIDHIYLYRNPVE
ncbi:MAG: class I SAM-dependent methyltransferase, partial [Magnetococcales bacterium]|nr:class I SAM-dependent methyltransferase [Magnetococcales bacterium]